MIAPSTGGSWMTREAGAGEAVVVLTLATRATFAPAADMMTG